MGIDAGLKAALDEFGAKAKARLREATSRPLEHLDPSPLAQVEPKKIPTPKAAPSKAQPKTAQAQAFAQKPEPAKSPPARVNKCKARPKSNRSKVGGGSKKRFIPWC